MKMKKLLACGLSLAMMISATVANAALVYEESDDYAYVATELPSKEDIMALNPTLDVTTEIVKTQSVVKDFTSTSFSNNHDVTAFDVYKLNFTFSDLGDLFNGFDADDERAWAAIYSFKAQLKTSAIADGDFAFKSGKMPTGGSTKFTQAGDYLQLLWTAADVENPYPKYADDDTSVLAEDASVTFTTIIAVKPGTVITIDEVNAVLTYNVVGTNYQLNNANITVPTSVQIGEKAPDPEPEADPVEVELKESNANGYIWYVEVADEMDAFGAKFYAAGDKTAEREIRNMDALPKLDGDVAYKFNVGLKLNTIDSIEKAEFTANGFTATWPEAE